MTKDELEKLLGRPLTPTEDANFSSYADITQEAAQDLLCMNLAEDPDSRLFNIRTGYSTVFTDLFKSVSEVKIDGDLVESSEYYTAFWDNRNLSYKNSLVFDNLHGKLVEITADFGFDPLPLDLQRLLARAYAQSVAPTKKKNTSVKSKRVEDFWITYGDLSEDEEFIKTNSATIKKYSLCNIGYVLHGDTCKLHGRYRCGYCI